jgi:hypothetical protein
MKKRKLTADEKQMKLHEQRFAMVILLCNVLDSTKGVSDDVKSAICASLLNIIEMSMIPDDDGALINLINNSIDMFCYEVQETKGVENYRDFLLESVKQAKHIVDALNEKVQRIKVGEDILKNISLN